MKSKPKSIGGVIIVVAAVAVLLAAGRFLGIGTVRHTSGVGVVRHEGWHDWSSSYVLLDGYMEHTIRSEREPQTYLVETETREGKISIEIKDRDGNVLFSKSDMGTDSFEVEIPGRVEIRVDVDGHRGSFRIGPAE